MSDQEIDQKSKQEIKQDPSIESRSNDKTTVLFKTKPGCIIRMEVQTAPIMSQQAHAQALKETKKQVSLPGFRKGKAPDAVLSTHFGREIQERHNEILINSAFSEAIHLVQRRPISTKSVRKAELKHMAKDGSAVFLFEYEAFPSVPKISLSELKSSKPITVSDPSEKMLDDALLKIKILHSEQKPIQDRAAQEGDAVRATISDMSLVEPEPLYLIKRGIIPDLLFDSLIGMQIDESKIVQAPRKDGSTAPCTITLSQIFEISLPEETDELATKAGASSLADLKEKIVEREKNALKEKAKEARRREFQDDLIIKYAFDLPQSIVEEETDARFNAYKEDAAQTEEAQAEADSLRQTFQEEVKRYFTCLFLMEQLSQEIQAQVNQSELFKELYHQMAVAAPHERVIFKGLSQERIMQRVASWIMLQKYCDICLD